RQCGLTVRVSWEGVIMSKQYLTRATRPSFKSVLLASVAAFAAGTSSALAQLASADEGETVTVTGYAGSLGAARNIKKDATIQEGVIVAEDIAKFPELNLAESLQRITGVQITREAGDGRQISLQGLGPDFTRVQLNGMEVLGNDDSALDARGQRSRDRSF